MGDEIKADKNWRGVRRPQVAIRRNFHTVVSGLHTQLMCAIGRSCMGLQSVIRCRVKGVRGFSNVYIAYIRYERAAHAVYVEHDIRCCFFILYFIAQRYATLYTLSVC